ncbi:MAG: hypothetical protein HYS57_00155 [Parcubacteria group bacterium]|nr:hypothetical protein [Parcubacteria group bacterium]
MNHTIFMLYILCGDDVFRRERHERSLLDGARAEGAEVAVFEMPDALDAALSFFLRPSLFPQPKLALLRRCEVLRGPSFATCGEACKFAESEEGGASTFIISCHGELPKGVGRLGGKIQQFRTLRGSQFAAWIGEYAFSLGATLTPAAMAYLARAFPGDSARVSQELEKLASWKPGGEIGVEDLSIVSSEFRGDVFGLLDGILARDRVRAVRLLHEVLEGGVEPPQILGALASAFRAMLVVTSGGSGAAITRLLEHAHPFWISKIKRASKNFRPEEIQKIYSAIFRGEYAIKTGREDAVSAVEGVVLFATSPLRALSKASTSGATQHLA